MKKDQMRYMQSWGEVAPSLVLLTHQKPSSRFPKLETILEEGSENCFKFTSHRHKGVLFAVPVVMSVVSFYFLRSRLAFP